MTAQEALSLLNDMEFDKNYQGVQEYTEMLIVCKEALEKQIPKKPDCGYGIFYSEDARLCPVCGGPNPDTYCGTCGQRLDWSDIT